MKKLLIFIHLLIPTALFSQALEYIPQDGLIEWFTLDEGDSIGYINSTPFTYSQSTAVSNRFGQSGRAQSFNSNQEYIQGPCNGFSSTDRTLAFWAKFDIETTENFLLGYGGGPSGTSTLLFANSNQCGAQGVLAHSQHSCQGFFTTPLSVLEEDNWNHIALTSDTEGSKLYINGALLAQSIQLGPVTVEERSFFIGGGPHPNGLSLEENYIGMLDDVGFWNRALSATEIMELYEAPAPILGCMDENACNFMIVANLQDACTYPLFNNDCEAGALACGPGQIWDISIQQCLSVGLFDSDFDGCVTASDLLDFLSAFENCDSTVSEN